MRGNMRMYEALKRRNGRRRRVRRERFVELFFRYLIVPCTSYFLLNSIFH